MFTLSGVAERLERREQVPFPLLNGQFWTMRRAAPSAGDRVDGPLVSRLAP